MRTIVSGLSGMRGSSPVWGDHSLQHGANSLGTMIAPVVSAAWTAEHLQEIVLADVRWYLDGRPGRAEYDRGHLPGAVFVELEAWLAPPASPQEGRHPLPDPEVFARGMGQLGIADADAVVAYDDQGGVI